MANDVDDSFERVANRFAGLTNSIEDQIRRRIVGQGAVVLVMIALACGGRLLLEGVPGLGKTQMLKALADSVQATFGRIQFTPDLMPADVISTQVIRTTDTGDRDFVFVPATVFANLVLADEINQAHRRPSRRSSRQCRSGR